MFQRGLPATPTESVGTPRPGMRGFLKKMGGMRFSGAVWHERFVVIENGVMQYYVERWEPDAPPPPPKSAQPLPLEALRVHYPPRRKLLGRAASEFVFEIETQGKSFVFCASSGRELQQWVQALRPGSSQHAPPTPTQAGGTPGEEQAAGGMGVVTRQPFTQLEATEAAVSQEFAFLLEELQRMTVDSAEHSATLALIDGLRPFCKEAVQ